MTDPNTLAAQETFTSLQRTLCARRVLPDRLKTYAHVDTGSVDWMGLIERVDRPTPRDYDDVINPQGRKSDRAAVAIVAHLLGVHEALRVAPEDTFIALLELVDRNTRIEALTCLTLLHALIEL